MLPGARRALRPAWFRTYVHASTQSWLSLVCCILVMQSLTRGALRLRATQQHCPDGFVSWYHGAYNTRAPAIVKGVLLALGLMALASARALKYL